MKAQIADNINILGDFCGKRDVQILNSDHLCHEYGIRQADVMVLFGGSVLCGGDVLAQAMKDKLAKKYIIVGGAGHTTETLRQTVNEKYPQIATKKLPEAEIFDHYLETIYGLKADYLETESTNCGNNITYLLKLLEQNKIDFKSIILCQDATMQCRMDAGLRKYVSDDVKIINFAAYKAKVVPHADKLVFATDIYGIWDMDRYINLLMGEIPRLTDNINGYGPHGKNFIAHVDIPPKVQIAFEELQNEYGKEIRQANPLYASK